MTEYAFGSREERIQRIGALLSKAVTLLLSRECPAPPAEFPVPVAEMSKAPPKAVNETAALLDDTENAILNFVQKIGNASPRDIQNAFDLSKTTAFRKLAKLVTAGFLIRSGKTTAIRYKFDAFPRNDGVHNPGEFESSSSLSILAKQKAN